ncbi:SRPBCC family protein [Pseudarthrobacter oxydans]|jgi:carbon monoxide dehydrogenase subunit G|uniref:SRPBCC family protein n=1 Tax=Pseudarthrobacter oxydans TaxID=1671 RepID=UPI001E6B5A88|nr:carbon monoxide dehydrogenase subunit G family protein [Arthrobacter sp. NtRootA9]BFE43543.1 SRPBCC family protein [Pseudarthrobacter oxydans]
MEMTNTFTVPVPPDEAWPVLLDLQRIAPMLPGASITSVDGDEYEGKAKIKVGPITAEYVGVARFIEVDEKGRRAVIQARAKDARGQGNMSATITARLEPEANGATVIVQTELDMTGKIAQFGRGVINEAATAILGVFAQRLAVEMTSGSESSSEASELSKTEAAPGREVKQPLQAESEVLDLIKLAKDTRAAKKGPGTQVEVPAVGQWLPAIVSIVAALIAVFSAGVAAGSNRRS